MTLIETLGELLGRNPSRNDVAGHIADRISAMERNRNCFRANGDVEGMGSCTQGIRNLRREARRNELSPDDYSSLFR